MAIVPLVPRFRVPTSVSQIVNTDCWRWMVVEVKSQIKVRVPRLHQGFRRPLICPDTSDRIISDWWQLVGADQTVPGIIRCGPTYIRKAYLVQPGYWKYLWSLPTLKFMNSGGLSEGDSSHK